jgi:hypothetical protein
MRLLERRGREEAAAEDGGTLRLGFDVKILRDRGLEFPSFRKLRERMGHPALRRLTFVL